MQTPLITKANIYKWVYERATKGYIYQNCRGCLTLLLPKVAATERDNITPKWRHILLHLILHFLSQF